VKVLIIIPAYNEEENIEKVVKNLENSYGQFDYVILNDGSKDKTLEKCRENKFNVIDVPINIGLVGVFQIGMKYALENSYDMALQFDADGQHQPEYIEKMVTCMEKTEADIVIGARSRQELKAGGMRGVGSRLISQLIHIVTGRRISDPTSGMRLFNRRMIRILAKESNIPPEPDMLAYMLRQGYSVEEVPVVMKKREFGKSYLSMTKASKYMIIQCTSIIFVRVFRGSIKE